MFVEFWFVAEEDWDVLSPDEPFWSWIVKEIDEEVDCNGSCLPSTTVGFRGVWCWDIGRVIVSYSGTICIK